MRRLPTFACKAFFRGLRAADPPFAILHAPPARAFSEEMQDMSRLSAYPVFHAVFEERRLAKAAQRLCVTPTAVSHSLRDFEQRLCVKLFERTPQGLVPTPRARRLYGKTKPLFDAVRDTEEALLQEKVGQSEGFALASVHTFIRFFFVPVVGELSEALAPAKIRFLTRSMRETAEAVAQGEALVGGTMLPIAAPERFFVMPLTPLPEYFLASSAFLQAAQQRRRAPGSPWTLEEIVREPLITLQRDSVSFAGYSRYFEQYGLHIEPRYEVLQEDLGFDLAARGLGVFIGFDPRLFGFDGLEMLDCRQRLPARDLVLICRREKADAKTRRLMEAMAARVMDLIRRAEKSAAP